jgi:hypothetical protein
MLTALSNRHRVLTPLMEEASSNYGFNMIGFLGISLHKHTIPFYLYFPFKYIDIFIFQFYIRMDGTYNKLGLKLKCIPSNITMEVLYEYLDSDSKISTIIIAHSEGIKG